MTAVFIDGFDAYNGATAPAGLAAKYTVTATPTLVAGRFGGQAVRFAVSSTNLIKSPTFPGGAVSSLTLGMGVQIESLDADPLICLNSAATRQVAFRFHTDGSLGAYRSTTLLGSSAAAALSLNTWYTLEIEIVISDTVGRITVYLDGVSILNLTSQDTRNGAPTTVDNIWLGAIDGLGVGAAQFDDLYVTDSATKPTAALRVETLRPDSDGATLNLTPSAGSDHFAVVDETTVDSSDYLQGSTVGDLDELGLGNLSNTPTAIEAVQIVGHLQKTDATARSMALEVKSGATTSTGGNYTLTTTGGRHERILATDPDTAAAWGASGVNALKVRPKVTV